MKNPASAFHGSDLEKISQSYGIPKESILNFGGNINPLGLSPAVKEKLALHLDVISSYPDREYKDLKSAAASYVNTESEYILPGSGATELISLLIKTLAPKKALIINPAYSEYQREISLSGGSYTSYFLEEEKNFVLNTEDFLSVLKEDYDLLIFCNPNNPTSSAISAEQMELILSRCLSCGIYVIVDETYAEFAPDHITAVPLARKYENLAVLRGTSKFFAAPGLRLGYAIIPDKKIRDRILSRQDPWSVNSLAVCAGPLLFEDTSFITKTKSLICLERERLYRIFSQMEGLKVYPAYGNFFLLKLIKPGVTSEQVFDFCIRQGIMIRDCSTFPSLGNSFIRFCILNPEENDRLVQALKNFLA